jgi:MFS transporter, NNP family, nitrate/nitrite transporter
MDLREFRRAGHLPTLICAFMYFTMSCMVWVLVGGLATSIIPDLGELTDSQQGLLLATGMALLGIGNGAVFQLVAQRFPGEIGVITGIVGAAGGLGDSCCRTSSAACGS